MSIVNLRKEFANVCLKLKFNATLLELTYNLAIVPS